MCSLLSREGGVSVGRVRLSGGDWKTDFKRRTTGRVALTAMEIAAVRRDLNGTLTELQRAIDAHAVAQAAHLYTLAWGQASAAPPSVTREQRARLKELKEALSSPSWKEAERRLAASQKRRRATPAVSAGEVTGSPPSSGPRVEAPVVRYASSDAAPKRRRPQGPDVRAAEPALLDAGGLWELATDLRPLLEQTARDGSITSWTGLRKRMPSLPRLHRGDQAVLLWLVDEARHAEEPLLCALVTVGDRQMYPAFPQIAERLGLEVGHSLADQRAQWSWQVLKVHQHWRHRR